MRPIVDPASRRILSSWLQCSPHLRSLLRLILGLMLLEYGLAKIFGFPVSISKGEPLPPIIYASGLIELACGFLLAVGLFTRAVAVLVSGEMAVVYFTYFLPKGPLPATNGGDLSITWCFLLLYLSSAGGGPVGLDALLKRRFRKSR